MNSHIHALMDMDDYEEEQHLARESWHEHREDYITAFTASLIMNAPNSKPVSADFKEVDCIICYNSVLKAKTYYQCNECSHTSCHECFKEWVTKSHNCRDAIVSCPMCRSLEGFDYLSNGSGDADLTVQTTPCQTV
jgi:hypothetical protein